MLKRLGEKSSCNPKELGRLAVMALTTKILLIALIVILILGHMDVALSRASDYDSAHMHNKRGLQYSYNNEHDKAIESFQKAIQLEPLTAEYHFNLATLLALHREASMRSLGIDREGLYAVMMIASRNAWRIKPKDIEIMRSHAYNSIAAHEYGATADWNEAVEVWEQYLASREELCAGPPHTFTCKSGVGMLLILAEIHLNAGRPQRAQVFLDRATTINPESRRAPLIQARIHAVEDQGVAGEAYCTATSTRLHAEEGVEKRSHRATRTHGIGSSTLPPPIELDVK